MPILYLDDDQNPDASLEDVEAAVGSLDGARYTLVLVELPSGRTLTIGGGPHRFVAEVAESDTIRWAAIDPAAANDPVSLVVGGQQVDYPGRLCVDRDTVLRAVRTFVEAGGARNPQLVWSVET